MKLNRWKSFGASVCGLGHVRSGLPNQDAFALATHWHDGAVVAVSDGVGSCPHSDIGSAAACRAVLSSASKYCRSRRKSRKNKSAKLSKAIHQDWLRRLSGLSPRDCSATCLFAVVPNNGAVLLGMLGDGLAAALKTTGEVITLSDDKTDSFSNLTSALSMEFFPAQWRFLFLPVRECRAVLLCTDGVADDILPEKTEDFVRSLILHYANLPEESVNSELAYMLEHWTTAGHTDDKTIVCLCSMEGWTNG
jgi:serine/threonine protein phosphatase PrpC